MGWIDEGKEEEGEGNGRGGRRRRHITHTRQRLAPESATRRPRSWATCSPPRPRTPSTCCQSCCRCVEGGKVVRLPSQAPQPTHRLPTDPQPMPNRTPPTANRSSTPPSASPPPRRCGTPTSLSSTRPRTSRHAAARSRSPSTTTASTRSATTGGRVFGVRVFGECVSRVWLVCVRGACVGVLCLRLPEEAEAEERGASHMSTTVNRKNCQPNPKQGQALRRDPEAQAGAARQDEGARGGARGGGRRRRPHQQQRRRGRGRAAARAQQQRGRRQCRRQPREQRGGGDGCAQEHSRGHTDVCAVMSRPAEPTIGRLRIWWRDEGRLCTVRSSSPSLFLACPKPTECIVPFPQVLA